MQQPLILNVRPWGRALTGSLLLVALLPACSLPDIPLPAPAEVEVVDPPCVSIPRSTSWYGYAYETPDETIWYSGCYNPANADEAAVVADLPDPARSQPGSGLYRMNLRTGQRTLIFDGISSQTVDWSRTGWILFNRGGEAWKVKANGDSAIQFTSTNRVLNGTEAWSPDGKQVLCQRYPPGHPQPGLVIYTDKGVFVRLMPDASTRAFSGISWSPDGRRLAYAGGPNSPVAAPRLCLYDLATDRIDTLDVLPRSAHGLSGVRWLPNGQEVVWAGSLGVSITNVQTRRTRQLRANCPGDFYIYSRGLGYPSPSPDGQRILVSRGDFAVSPTYPADVLIAKHSLETMNVHGGQIRKVTP